MSLLQSNSVDAGVHKDEPFTGERRFATNPTYWWGGLFGVVVYTSLLCFVVGSYIFPSWAEVFPRPGLRILCLVLFGTFTILAVYVLAIQSRTELIVSKTRLRLVTPLRDRIIDFSRVRKLRWRTIPKGGSAVFQTPEYRLVVDFCDFENRRELQSFLRSAVAIELQENFENSSRAWGARKPSPVVRGNAAVGIAVGSLIVAILGWVFQSYTIVFMSLSCLQIFCLPAMFAVLAMDFVRRPERAVFIAAAITVAAIVVFAITIAPVVRVIAG